MPAAPYDKLVPALKALLPSAEIDALGRSVSFIRRLREIRAGGFVWSVVLSRFCAGRPAFEQARRCYEQVIGVWVWPRPFQMRFKARSAVALFERVFEMAVRYWRTSRRVNHPLAKCFADVVLIDSTDIQLFDALRPIFKGAGASVASLKVLLTVSAFGLVPLAATLFSGNRNDQQLFPSLSLFRRGSLLLFDKGFVQYERLRTIERAGLYFLCPMRLNGNPRIVGVRNAPRQIRLALARNPDGLRLRDVLEVGARIHGSWDIDIVLKSGDRPNESRCRLVLVPGRKNVVRPYLTNLAARDWSPAAIAELYRVRWQIELVFKELKQHLNLESVNSRDEHAVQVLTWASLIALLVSRTLANCVSPFSLSIGLRSPIRPSLVSRALRGAIRILAKALGTPLSRSELPYAELLFDQLRTEVRSRDGDRADSFGRIGPLLAR
jgi:putative transposase